MLCRITVLQKLFLYSAFYIISSSLFFKPCFGVDNANQKLNFSHTRGVYNASFELVISTNSSTAKIYYTVDCSTPTAQNGKRYKNAILIDSTLVVKAVAVEQGTSSMVYTNTYIFPDKTAHQTANPDGFPVQWGGVKTIAADYEMDTLVTRSLEYKTKVIQAFNDLPSLCLSMPANEWFDSGNGIYVSYENTNISREKPVCAEFVFNTDEKNFAVECGVQNQGGTSIVNWKSPKQSMRLLFKEIYGPTRLQYKLFADSEIESINTLVVDAMLNATWIHPKDDQQRQHAMYLRDQLTSDLYNKMGRLSVHGRYFHLFLNGLYWGIVNLHERPDDAFLSEYYDANREDFDIIKHNPTTVVAGTNHFYESLLKKVRTGIQSNSDLSVLSSYLDIPAFIDYMILNFYLGNFDWAQHNYYAGKNRTSAEGARFYPWDSEHVMRFLDVEYNNTQKNNEGGPTEIHTLLKENEEYRMMFADAVYQHCFNNGALSPENFRAALLKRAEEIENAIILESARWGDYRKNVSGVTYTKNDYWQPEINQALENYIPLRRDIFIQQLQNNNNKLFPEVMPPIIDTKVAGQKTEVTLKAFDKTPGVIYYTLDGSDPRKAGGEIQGQEYQGKFDIAKTTLLKTRFYSTLKKEWSALVVKEIIQDDIYGEGLVINEIMYHPAENYPEFIEIMNFGPETIFLNGFTISGGIDYKFTSDQSLEPRSGAVLTNDMYTFKTAYNTSAFAQYNRQLSNKGESIVLKNGFNQLVDFVAYTDTIPWPVEADGDGYSLELIDANLDNSLASSWKASETINGSPFGVNSFTENGIFIYPNPAKYFLIIDLNNIDFADMKFKVDIYDLTGICVRREQIRASGTKLKIDLAGFRSGMYFIRLNTIYQTTFNSAIIKVFKAN